MRSAFGVAIVLCSVTASGSSLIASGHGPVFGMATPTNGAGGWAIDFGAMGRVGEPDNASAIRTMLTYGINEDLQIATSVPSSLAQHLFQRHG